MEERSGFLDTPIHVTMQIGDPYLRSSIQSELDKYDRVGTATYCKFEFKDTVIRDVDFALRKLKELGSVAEVQRFLTHWQARSRVNRILSIFANMLEFEECKTPIPPGGTLDDHLTKAAVEYLRIAVEAYWLKLETSLRGMHEIRDGTGCLRAKQTPTETASGDFELYLDPCRKDQPNCDIANFFTRNRHFFQQILEVIKALEPAEKSGTELPGFERVIEVCLRDPTELCSSQNCKKLADAIIAVEGEGYSEIYSSNYKEFGVLCRGLNRKFNRLPVSRRQHTT